AATTGHIADPGAGETTQDGVVVPATPTLQSIAKMGSYPLQRAGAFATFLNSQSKRMSNLLATESMGYVEKVSGMWKGGRKHYDEPLGLRTDDDDDDDDEDDDDDDDDGAKVADSMDRFRSHFALPETEKLQATYFGYLMRVLPLYGKIYVSARHFCFRSLLPGTRTKLILPLRDIENVDKEKGFRFGYSGLVVVVRGHEELFFEFGQAVIRDDCAVTLLQYLETARYLRESGVLSRTEREDIESALAERDALQEARVDDEHHPGHPHPHHARTRDVTLPRDDPGLGNNDGPTILFDDPKASFLTFKPLEPLRVTCLTIGSRGDVQPYIALCRGLLAEGHRPR
ncbi:MAG: GRAM domain-containing protein, partial [Thaumarchaeota archaeon]|nr:GRAM domain-containing protein [Nitrososphaerota archaeon]